MMSKAKGRNGRLQQATAAFVASIGAFSLGTLLVWSSPALPHIADCIHKCDYLYTADQGSWIVSLATLGTMIGCFATGFLMDIFGRKWTIIGMAVPLIFGWILMLIPQLTGINPEASIWIFYVGRFILGFSGGTYLLVSSIYISECSEPDIRGTFGNSMPMMICLGVLFVNSIGSLVHWMVLTAICIIFPALILMMMPFMPESPVYLLSKEREADAINSLKRLRGPNHDTLGEIQLIRKSLAEKKALGAVSAQEMLSKRKYLIPTIVSLMLMILQQLSGITPIMFYLSDIFMKANTSISVGLQATLVSLIQCVGVLVSMFLVDRFGRKGLILTSTLGSSLCVIALGTYFYIDENKCMESGSEVGCDGGFNMDIVNGLNWIPVVSIMIFIFFMSIGIGPLPWIMIGELFPEECKSASSSLSAIANQLMAFTTAKTVANIQAVIGYSGTFFLYGSLCMLGTVYILFGVPETKGKTPEEILQYFKVGARQECTLRNWSVK